MSDKKHHVPIHDDAQFEDINDTEAQAEAAAPDPSAVELEQARKEARESQDKYLRLYAETDNFKKRMIRESAEREKYYNEGIIKDMLPVLDNLDRALAHNACESTATEAGIVEGVKMVRKQFGDVLAKYGVTAVESVGQPFDPERHQAMMPVPTDEHEPGTVLDEFQKGYLLNERLLRPAMVTVAAKKEE